MDEVTTVFVNPFPEDNMDWTLITHECEPCGIRKKIFCDNPDLIGIEKSPLEEFKDSVVRDYGLGKERDR